METNSKIISWNTNRFYGKAGQRMAAMCVRSDKFPYSMIAFVDIDRGIDGLIIGNSQNLNRDAVMSAYDHCQYVSGLYHYPEADKALREAAAQVAPIDSRYIGRF